MRTLAILMVALLAASITPDVSAQDATAKADWITLLEDPDADVRFVGPGGQEALPGRFGSFDLESLRALETPEDIVFELKVRELDAATELTYLESADYRITFTHADRTYRITASRWTEAGQSGVWGWVEQLNPGNNEWDYAGTATIVQDEAADTLTATVARSLLHDGDGATPYPGRFFTDFQAVGRHLELNPEDLGSISPEPAGLIDTMPDEGVGDVDMGFVYGVPQTGDVRLASERPFRISNGEATTLVYDVTVENSGDDADRFRLEAEEIPEAWSIRFPEPVVTLDAGESASVRVLATMPFTHKHGDSLSFVMHARSETDDSDAGLELGVLFTVVPQPSGHHSRVWFHTIPWGGNLVSQATAADPGPEQYLTFNAEQEYAADSYESVQSSWTCSVCGTESRSWYAFLSPSLGMGLDFDLDSEGLVSIPIESTTPMQGMDLRLTLWHWATDDRENYDSTKVFDVTVAAGDWDAQETRTLDMPFSVLKGADRFEVRQYQGLTLQIELLGDGPGINSAADPRVVPGGYMDLPLFEYHDAVEDLDDTANTLTATALGETERFANPGRTVTFPVRIENHADTADVQVSVTGVHADWTQVSPAEVHLDRHGSSEAVVAVTVPGDIPDGELVDLVVEAVADDGRAALQRVRVIVDTDADHMDESGLLDDGSVETPGLGATAVLAIACLAALGVLRRRD